MEGSTGGSQDGRFFHPRNRRTSKEGRPWRQYPRLAAVDPRLGRMDLSLSEVVHSKKYEIAINLGRRLVLTARKY
jgi:hypothetical protein